MLRQVTRLFDLIKPSNETDQTMSDIHYYNLIITTRILDTRQYYIRYTSAVCINLLNTSVFYQYLIIFLIMS